MPGTAAWASSPVTHRVSVRFLSHSVVLALWLFVTGAGVPAAYGQGTWTRGGP